MEKLFLSLLCCFAWQISIASAGELERGIQFFEQKDYAKAKKLWQPLAKKGDVRAQYNMVLLFKQEFLKQESFTNNDRAKNQSQREKATQYLVMSRSKGLVDGYYITMSEMDSAIVNPDISDSTTQSKFKNEENEPLVWLNQQSKSAYTLQLATGKSRKSMEKMQKKLISSQSLNQPDNIYIHTIEKIINGKSVLKYVLVYGVFKTYQEAKDEVGKLPEAIQKSSPWIRQLGVIQSIVKIKKKNNKT